jgi:hypothetical protein
MTSLSRSVITSEVMTLREARVIWGHYWPLSQIRTKWNNLKGYNLLSWEATFPSTSGPSCWPSARPGYACLPGYNFSSSEKKIIWFGLAGFLLVHKGFSIAGRFAYSADMFLKIKTVWLHVVIPEMCSFSMRPAKYFYDKPLPK